MEATPTARDLFEGIVKIALGLMGTGTFIEIVRYLFTRGERQRAEQRADRAELREEIKVALAMLDEERESRQELDKRLKECEDQLSEIQEHP